MGKRKTPYNDYNASVKSNEHYGTLFEGMVKSQKYRDLSSAAKNLYSVCRVQAKSKQGRACLYKHGEEEGKIYNSDVDFVFPATHLEEYGFDRSNAAKLFRQLENSGFINIKESNGHRHKVNVYSFSDRWKRK